MKLIDLYMVFSVIEEIENLDPVTGADTACVTCWVNACRSCKDAIRKIRGSKHTMPAKYLHHSGNILPDSSELLEIHTILMAPGDCPPPSETDTITVKLLKDIIHDRARMRRLMCDFTVVTHPSGQTVESCSCTQMMDQLNHLRTVVGKEKK